MEIRIADTDAEILACFDVVSQLRPKLVREEFVARVRAQMGEGYRLLSLSDERSDVVACAGFRIFSMLHAGRILYVDDLVTSEDQRSKGYGDALIRWLRQHAIESECEQLHLDSGVHRARAHAFYFRSGLHISDFHFSAIL